MLMFLCAASGSTSAPRSMGSSSQLTVMLAPPVKKISTTRSLSRCSASALSTATRRAAAPRCCICCSCVIPSSGLPSNPFPAAVGSVADSGEGDQGRTHDHADTQCGPAQDPLGSLLGPLGHLDLADREGNQDQTPSCERSQDGRDPEKGCGDPGGFGSHDLDSQVVQKFGQVSSVCWVECSNSPKGTI